jgi:hypothetical protein
MHERFHAFKHDVHANSAEEAMTVLLGADVLHIPMPAVVMERWREEAEACGYPLEQWVAQCVESWLANRVRTPEIQEALALKRRLEAAEVVQAVYSGEAPPGVDPKRWGRRVPEEGAYRPGTDSQGRPVWNICDDCTTPHTCAEKRDLDRCP